MIVLGIESSCDETAAALVRDDGEVLADVVSSQVKVHEPYGGVVPEIAARAHLSNLTHVLEQALAPVARGEVAIDGVAVTAGPGLVGALLVGVQAGKALAFARGLPLVGVNHLVGHLLAVHLRHTSDAPMGPGYPYVALLVSGGHTALYEVRSPLDVEQLGQTRDDAAGEAFDKVAKLLGLGYPGGPIVDRLAGQGRADAVAFPRPLLRRGSLDFSFAGLKTAVAQHVSTHGHPRGDAETADLCASFQRAVVEVLVAKALAACRDRGVPRLVLTGGVAANRGLRAHAADACAKQGVVLHVPPIQACTDNAAMIAYAGSCLLRDGRDDGLDIPIFSRSPILGAKAGSPALRRYRSSRLPKRARAD